MDLRIGTTKETMHGVPTKCSRARYPLWGHGEEEMGRELGLHGALRLHRRPRLLGPMGPSHVLRGQAHFNSGPAQSGAGRKVYPSPIYTWVCTNG